MMNLLKNFKLPGQDQKIALTDKTGLHFFEVKNIIHCKSDNSYTEFFILKVDAGRIKVIRFEVSKGICEYEDFLVDKGLFFRVHNQHIINISHIIKYSTDESRLVMNYCSDETIPVARSRKDDFMRFLKNKGMTL